jgi:hypothetical protein
MVRKSDSIGSLQGGICNSFSIYQQFSISIVMASCSCLFLIWLIFKPLGYTIQEPLPVAQSLCGLMEFLFKISWSSTKNSSHTVCIFNAPLTGIIKLLSYMIQSVVDLIVFFNNSLIFFNNILIIIQIIGIPHVQFKLLQLHQYLIKLSKNQSQLQLTWSAWLVECCCNSGLQSAQWSSVVGPVWDSMLVAGVFNQICWRALGPLGLVYKLFNQYTWRAGVRPFTPASSHFYIMCCEQLLFKKVENVWWTYCVTSVQVLGFSITSLLRIVQAKWISKHPP